MPPQRRTLYHCPVCISPGPATNLIAKRGYSYGICESCESASLTSPPSETEAETAYGRDYFHDGAHLGGYSNYDADERIHRQNARSRLARIERLVSPGRVLDVGCASGYFLDEATRSGWEAAGADVSEWARARVREAFPRIKVHRTVALAALSAGEGYDVVCAAQVLEHTVSPRRVVSAVASALRPGGLLFMETWDRTSLLARLLGSRWQQVSPPSVLHLFSRTGIDRMLRAAGFKDVRMRRGHKRVSLGFAASAGLKNGQRGWGVRRLLGMSVGRLQIPYFFADLITVEAVLDSAGATAPRRAARVDVPPDSFEQASSLPDPRS